MKSMKSAKEFYSPPPKGKYPAKIVEAEAGFSKKNESHIRAKVELIDGPGKGEQADTWIGTDGTTRYGGMGKSKLRGLGVPVDSDAEIPDEQICRDILGRNVIVEIDHEPQMSKGPSGEYDTPATFFDPTTGVTHQIYKWVIKGFQTVNTGAQIAHAPQQMPQTQQFAPPAPQQFVPPQGGFVPGVPGAPPQIGRAHV